MTATISSTIQTTISASIPGPAGDPILDPDHPDREVLYPMTISGTTCVDTSPNAFNGAITGAVTIAGLTDSWLRFDGNDEVISSDYADFGTSTDFTVYAWINTSDATKNKVVINKRAVVTGWLLYISTAGFLVSAAHDGINTAQAVSTTAVNDGADHLLISSFDRDGNVSSSIDDGAEEGATSIASVGDISSNAQVTIGNKSPQTGATGATWMIGDIGGIGIIRRLLTATEKTAIFDKGPP